MILSIISHFRCHLYIFFGEVSILITCPFCNWIIVFFLGGVSDWIACGTWVPWPGSEPDLWQWKCRTWLIAVKVQNGQTTRKLQELFSAWVLRFFVYFGYHSIITHVFGKYFLPAVACFILWTVPFMQQNLLIIMKSNSIPTFYFMDHSLYL